MGGCVIYAIKHLVNHCKMVGWRFEDVCRGAIATPRMNRGANFFFEGGD